MKNFNSQYKGHLVEHKKEDGYKISKDNLLVKLDKYRKHVESYPITDETKKEYDITDNLIKQLSSITDNYEVQEIVHNNVNKEYKVQIKSSIDLTTLLRRLQNLYDANPIVKRILAGKDFISYNIVSNREIKTMHTGGYINRDFKTRANIVSVREANKVADKKYDDSCDTERNYGLGALGFGVFGALVTLWTGGLATPLFFEGFAITNVTLYGGAALAAGGGAGAAAHGYAAKKVGRTGSYADLVTMATGSLGHTGRLMADELAAIINSSILNKLVKGIVKVKEEFKKEGTCKLIDDLLAGHKVRVTEIKKFDDAVNNTVILLQDLHYLYRARKTAIEKNNGKENNAIKIEYSSANLKFFKEEDYIGKDVNYIKKFLDLKLDQQEQIIDSVANTIKESFLIAKDFVQNNRSIGNLEAELYKAKTESCQIL